LVLLVLFLILLGVGGLYLTTFLDEKVIAYHLVRDLSLAFLISGLVTGSYEIYIRRRVDLEKIESVLTTVAGSSVPPNVWDDIKRTLLNRKVIRRHVEIRLSLTAVGNDNYCLTYEFAYDLASLLPRSGTVPVIHGLDEHITNQTAGLPRFEACTFDDAAFVIPPQPIWESADKKVKVENGRLAFSVFLQPAVASGPGTSVRISVRRSEVRACPGSYYLLMTELTDGIWFYLESAPQDVKVILMVRPEDDEIELDAQKPLFNTNAVLLPGHGIEIKLKR
jgi:hypothetical protein